MTEERIRVLLVEDDAAFARATRRQLEHLGCAVVIISTIEGALDALTREEIDVVVADHELADAQTGSELLALVARTQPRVGRVLYSGTPGLTCAAAEVLLTKPAHLHELRRALTKVAFGGR